MTALISLLVLLVLERTRLRRISSAIIRPGFATDLVLLGIGLLATALTFGAIERAYAALRTSGVPRLEAMNIPPWISVIIALVLLDLGNYVAHVAMHRFDILWRFHKVHHSSPTLDWLATFRFHVVEIALRRLIAPFVLIAVGAPLDAVGVASSILIAWGMFNHSNLLLDLRILEPLLITPRLHFLHHAPSTSDRNFGTVFSVWDRLASRLVL